MASQLGKCHIIVYGKILSVPLNILSSINLILWNLYTFHVQCGLVSLALSTLVRVHNYWWDITYKTLGNPEKRLNVPKFSDKRVWANSVDPDQTEEQSDQGLHSLFAIPLVLFGYITLYTCI